MEVLKTYRFPLPLAVVLKVKQRRRPDEGRCLMFVFGLFLTVDHSIKNSPGKFFWSSLGLRRMFLYPLQNAPYEPLFLEQLADA